MEICSSYYKIFPCPLLRILYSGNCQRPRKGCWSRGARGGSKGQAQRSARTRSHGEGRARAAPSFIPGFPVTKNKGKNSGGRAERGESSFYPPLIRFVRILLARGFYQTTAGLFVRAQLLVKSRRYSAKRLPRIIFLTERELAV